jgi:hypothetical protein
VTEPTSEQIRTVLEGATVDAPSPHPWAEIERRAGSAGDPASSMPRPGIWLAAAACVVALFAGLVILPGSGNDEIRQDERPGIVPATTTSPTPPPTSTVDASTTVAPETTTVPSESTVPPGSGPPPALPRPVSGQTQQSIVGDITWTLIEDDASNVPQGPVIAVDGVYLGGVYDGRTWRSPDGLEWELVDLGSDGVADQMLYNEFEFQGETWAQTNGGLARWDGETFVPVALPESPFADLDGMRYGGRIDGAPVVLGDELVVPSTSFLYVLWDELFFDGAQAEWTGDPQAIHIVDTNSWDGPFPVVAVLSAEFVEGEPSRFEFRDVESNELVTTVEAIAGADPAVLLPRIIDGLYREILIGDADGFEAVEPPGGWGVPASLIGDVVPIEGAVLGIARPGHPTLTADGGLLGIDDWGLWTSTDARSWTRLDLPTPAGSLIDIVELASDGSTAILTVQSRATGRSPQGVEWWATVDGRQWERIDYGDVTASAASTMPGSPVAVRPAEFGWFVGYDASDISVSPDGRTWQQIRFEFPDFQGPGGTGTWAVGRSIFLTRQDEAEGASGPTHSMWVGRVADG